MSSIVNKVAEFNSLGLVKDVTGSEAAGKAGERAADIQSNAALAGIDENRRQFDLNRRDLETRIKGGNQAFNQQRVLLGLGGGDGSQAYQTERDELERKIAGIQFSSSGFGPSSGRGSEQGQSLSGGENLADLQGRLSEINAQNNKDQQAQAYGQLQESAGQRFLRDRQQKALLRNQSAIGGLGGGNVRTALQEQAMGFAQQDIQNQFGRLGQLAGQGQNAANVSGQLGAQSAGTIAGLQANQGAAQASGILAPVQANAAVTNQLLQLGGQAAGAYMGGVG